METLPYNVTSTFLSDLCPPRVAEGGKIFDFDGRIVITYISSVIKVFGSSRSPTPTILHKRFCVILCLPCAKGGGLRKQLGGIVTNIVEDPQLFIFHFSSFIIHLRLFYGTSRTPYPTICGAIMLIAKYNEHLYERIFCV